eukprot:TRINITY_DN21465_c0_g1_i1.p1 TRINITY_DN21465_c0_g1~~TRINITY_DN21465_c0_g1_i1.p1  ORF type:complete len:304 (+),score=54.71 TRINITY_DN21465_c0_g1_i1:41-913(+)
MADKKPYVVLSTSQNVNGELDRMVVEGREGSPPVKFEVVVNKDVGGLIDVVVIEPVNIGKWLDVREVRQRQEKMESVVRYVVGRYKEKMEEEAEKKCKCALRKLLDGYEYRLSHNIATGATEVIIKIAEGPVKDSQVSYVKVSRYNDSLCHAELKGPDSLYQLYGSRDLRTQVTPSPETWIEAVKEVDSYLVKKKQVSTPNVELQSAFYARLQTVFGSPIGNDHTSLTFMQGEVLFQITVPSTYPCTPPPPTIHFPGSQKIFQPPKDQQHDIEACVKYFSDKVALETEGS